MPNIKINFHEIRELIPHREPFLFLDELVDIIKLTKATGIKSIVDAVNKARGVKDCGCGKRRDALNKMFPYKK